MRLAGRDVMSSHDVVSLARREFRKGRNAQHVADALTTSALRRRTVDNVSVVVVDLGGGEDGWPAKAKQKGRRNPFVSLFVAEK